MERKFDIDWPHGHVTVSGRKARIVCRNVKNTDKPLLALVTFEGAEQVYFYKKDGEYSGPHYLMDLQNAPEPEVDLGWINVYRENPCERVLGAHMSSKEQCDRFGSGGHEPHHLVLRDGKIVDVTDE